VPKGAKEIYKNGGNMGYFENIKEIDFDNWIGGNLQNIRGCKVVEIRYTDKAKWL
jgi:hypothetical protein